MEKLDLVKGRRELYFPSAKAVSEVDVPPMNFAMIDGEGDPAAVGGAYHASLEALFAVSYTLKFAIKKAGIADYRVMPPEGLWWTDPACGFDIDLRKRWKWTSMVMQPDLVTQARFRDAIAKVRVKKDLPSLAKLRLERYREGPSVQILHIGPYAEERPTIARLHKYIDEHGYKSAGKHHEIYLGNPRRTDPSRLKTVIRQPVKR